MGISSKSPLIRIRAPLSIDKLRNQDPESSEALMRRATILLISITALAATAESRRPRPEIFGRFEGEPMYSVLEAGAIPAIESPLFLTGAAADSQMTADEPVIGIVVDGEARAYSAWQLDSHEIVDDVVAGVPIAVNW